MGVVVSWVEGCWVCCGVHLLRGEVNASISDRQSVSEATLVNGQCDGGRSFASPSYFPPNAHRGDPFHWPPSQQRVIYI